MTIAVLIHEDRGAIEEIELDLGIKKNDIYAVLSGRATFIGQWPEIDVVIMKAVTAERPNENSLPTPFDKEHVMGKILLVRMDEDSEPRDFTLSEYSAWVARTRSP